MEVPVKNSLIYEANKIAENSKLFCEGKFITEVFRELRIAWSVTLVEILNEVPKQN